MYPSQPSIANNTTRQLAAEVTFPDGTTEDVTGSATWQAFPGTGTATVSSSGLVTATGAGTVSILASFQGVASVAVVTVTTATLSSIQITPPEPSFALGTTQQFAATGFFSDGTTQDLTPSATWSATAGTGAATINAWGLATGTAVGSATVHATFLGVSGAASTTVTAATLSTVQVTPPQGSVALGTAQQFAATGIFSDGTTQDLTTSATWSATAGTGAAGVTDQGLATGTAAGTVSVQASFGGISGTASLTVTEALLSSIEVSPPYAYAPPPGIAQQYAATGVFSDGTSRDLTFEVNWTALDQTGSATITPGGVATATAPGTVTLQANLSGVSGQATLMATEATLSSIAVTPASDSLALGFAQQYRATGTFSDGTTQDLTSQVSWTAAPGTGSATVAPGGLATATGVGSVTIQADLDGVSAQTPLTVTKAVMTSLAVTAASSSLPLGTSQQYAATGTFSDGSTQDLTSEVSWTALPGTGTATVTPEGLASATGLGTVTIQAVLDGVTGHATLTATAALLRSLAVTPAQASLAVGTSQQYTATGTFSDGSTQDMTNEVNWRIVPGTGTATVTDPRQPPPFLDRPGTSFPGGPGFPGFPGFPGGPGMPGGRVTGSGQGTVTVDATWYGLNNSFVTAQTSLTVTGAVLSFVSVSPTDATLIKGSTVQYSATGHFSDGSMQSLTNSAVSWSAATQTGGGTATITPQGLATATGGTGIVKISANFNGLAGNNNLFVADRVVSLSVTPPKIVIEIIGCDARPQLYAALAVFSDGTSRYVSAGASWSVSVSNRNPNNGASAVIDGNGTLRVRCTGLGGTTQFVISAVFGGVAASTTAVAP